MQAFEFAPPLQGMATIGAVRRQLFGLSTSSFYRLRESNADFPKQIDLGDGRRPMFDVAECLRWIQTRQRKRCSIQRINKGK
jgi:predicted DNA-binding transcriptional regulator AlpA